MQIKPYPNFNEDKQNYPIIDAYPNLEPS